MSATVVLTSSGQVQGLWKTSTKGKQFLAFRGIPYAKVISVFEVSWCKKTPKKVYYFQQEKFLILCKLPTNLDVQKQSKVKMSSKKQTNIFGHLSCS